MVLDVEIILVALDDVVSGNHIYEGGGFKYIYFYFHPYLGKWSNLTNIFQMGWNHQLVIILDWGSPLNTGNNVGE